MEFWKNRLYYISIIIIFFEYYVNETFNENICRISNQAMIHD